MVTRTPHLNHVFGGYPRCRAGSAAPRRTRASPGRHWAKAEIPLRTADLFPCSVPHGATRCCKRIAAAAAAKRRQGERDAHMAGRVDVTSTLRQGQRPSSNVIGCCMRGLERSCRRLDF